MQRVAKKDKVLRETFSEGGESLAFAKCRVLFSSLTGFIGQGRFIHRINAHHISGMQVEITHHGFQIDFVNRV